MSKTNRRAQKRKFASAYRHLYYAQEFLVEFYEKYHESHPLYAEYLKLLTQSIMITQEYMEDFATKTWGHFPDNIDKWLI